MTKASLTRRSLLRGALIGGATLLVAACAPAAPSQPTETPKPATAAPAATATPALAAAQPAAKKQVNLRWWMASRGEDLTAFETNPNTYMAKNPQVSIEVASIADGGLTKVQAAIAAGDPPELTMTWDRAGSAGIYYKGGLQVLDDYIKADKGFDAGALERISMEGCRSHDGKQWGIPDQLYVGSNLFYSPTMFKDKGLDPNQPPATLDDLEQKASLFDVKKGDQFSAVGFHPGAYHSSTIYAFAHAGNFFDANTGKITPDNRGVVAGVEWLVKYYHKYGIENLRRLQAGYGQYQSAQNAFLAGQVAMVGFWDALVAYRNRYAPKVEMQHAYFPFGANQPEAKGFGLLNFNPTWIAKGSKEKDAAWDVLKELAMDARSALSVAILLANTPQNLNAYTLPGAAQADPLLRKCWDYAAKGKMQYFPPTMPGMAEYSQEWGRQMDLMLAEKVSVKDGIQAIKDAVQPVVDKGLRGG
jgi:multiple sugar transport system substrate-binding protein